jgi:predicted MFS family arabinose efflux permease
MNNLVYAFVFAAIMTLLPLYLIDKNISLESIGIILSILPLTFLVVRLALGTLADEIGEKKVLLIQSFAMFLSPLVYAIAATPIFFAFGKIIEGARDSAFWAVSRTEIIHSYGIKKAEKSLAYFSGGRLLADISGRLLIGLSIAMIGFYNSLLALSLLGLLLVITYLLQKENNHNKLNIRHSFKRIIKRRSREFWKVSFGLMFLAASTGLFFIFLFPVFMFDSLGLGYEIIGSALAILLLFTGISMFIQLYLKLSARRMAIITIICMSSALLLFPIYTNAFWILILVFGIGHGSASILYEEILGNATKKSKDLSTDIGVIHIPLRIGEFISFIGAGFIIANFGYFPIFAISAFAVFLFGLFAYFYLSDKNHQFA